MSAHALRPRAVGGCGPTRRAPERAAPRDLVGEIGALYAAQFRRYVRVATAITGDAESGRDAVQDAFASALRHRRQFRGDGSLEGWLWRAVVNTASKHRRSAGRAAQALARAAEPASAREDERPDEALQRLVARLPERQRLVVFLRYYADLDYEDRRRARDPLGHRRGLAERRARRAPPGAPGGTSVSGLERRLADALERAAAAADRAEPDWREVVVRAGLAAPRCAGCTPRRRLARREAPRPLPPPPERAAIAVPSPAALPADARGWGTRALAAAPRTRGLPEDALGWGTRRL
ncbi:MAG: sigma-70 family RNA polymerase sigma factor [Thermoleophilia bacterium]